MERLGQFAIAESAAKSSGAIVDVTSSQKTALAQIIEIYHEARFTGPSLRYAKNWLMKLREGLQYPDDKAQVKSLIDGSKANVSKLRNALRMAAVMQNAGAASEATTTQNAHTPDPSRGAGMVSPGLTAIAALAKAKAAEQSRANAGSSGSSGEADTDPHSDRSSLSSSDTGTPPRAPARASVRALLLPDAAHATAPAARAAFSPTEVVVNPALAARTSFAAVVAVSRRSQIVSAVRANATASWP
jgi:hypothetical protein